MAGNMQRFTVILTIIVLSALPATAAQAGTPVTLPVEVVGENGTASSVTVEIPTPLAPQVRSLWIEIHGLSYAGMVSVEINEGNWVSLNNDTVSVAEPGKSYGGIGGGFPTLKVTLPLQEGAVVGGTNIIRFRFITGRPAVLAERDTDSKWTRGCLAHSRPLFRLPCLRWPGSQILRILERVDRCQVQVSWPFDFAGSADRKLHSLPARSEPGASMESALSAGPRIGCSTGRQLGSWSRAFMGARQRHRNASIRLPAEG